MKKVALAALLMLFHAALFAMDELELDMYASHDAELVDDEAFINFYEQTKNFLEDPPEKVDSSRASKIAQDLINKRCMLTDAWRSARRTLGSIKGTLTDQMATMAQELDQLNNLISSYRTLDLQEESLCTAWQGPITAVNGFEKLKSMHEQQRETFTTFHSDMAKVRSKAIDRLIELHTSKTKLREELERRLEAEQEQIVCYAMRSAALCKLLVLLSKKYKDAVTHVNVEQACECWERVNTGYAHIYTSRKNSIAIDEIYSTSREALKTKLEKVHELEPSSNYFTCPSGVQHFLRPENRWCKAETRSMGPDDF